MFQQMTAQMGGLLGGGTVAVVGGMDMLGFLMDMPRPGVLHFQESALPMPADELVEVCCPIPQVGEADSPRCGDAAEGISMYDELNAAVPFFGGLKWKFLCRLKLSVQTVCVAVPCMC
jgi:hypothetical protein